MKRDIAALLACGLLAAGGTVAQAQSAAPPAGSNATIPEKTAPSAAAPDTDIARKGGSLSDKLKDSNGVISPESNVDPAIRKPAPSTGTMPVIPPPGSPGGATDVQPK